MGRICPDAGTAASADAPIGPLRTADARPIMQSVSMRASLPVLVVALAFACAASASAAPDPETLLAPATRCGDPAVTAPLAGQPESQVASMLCYHNFARVQDGLAPLVLDPRLAAFGRKKLAAIVRCGAFTHAPCGRGAFSGFPRGFAAAGENLVYWSPVGTVRQEMDTWLHSPEHLDNVVSRSYARVGFAVYDGPAFGYPEVRMWVADFGS